MNKIIHRLIVTGVLSAFVLSAFIGFVLMVDHDPWTTISFTIWFMVVFLIAWYLLYFHCDLKYVVLDDCIVIKGGQEPTMPMHGVDIVLKRGEVRSITELVFSWRVLLMQGGDFDIPKWKIDGPELSSCLGCPVRARTK